MSDRYNALVVALEHDLRDDDAERLINAITQLRGVESVTGNAVDIDSYTAKTRIVSEVRKKLFEITDSLITL